MKHLKMKYLANIFRTSIDRLDRNEKFQKRLSYFINSSCLHGVRFLDRQFTYVERLCWFITLIASCIGMIVIFQYTINTYASDAIAINMDTTYLQWRNKFPAISFCMLRSENPSGTGELDEFIRTYYDEHNLSFPIRFDYIERVLDYLFITPVNNIYYWLPNCDEMNSTCGVNIDVLKKLFIPTNCSKIISNVKFNQKNFENCDEIFKAQQTEMGSCFTANGVYFYDYDLEQLPLTYDQSDLTRSFSFDFLPESFYSVHIFIHSPDEFPNFNSELRFQPIQYNAEFMYRIQTIETENTVEVRDESIEKRQCRFPDERWPTNASLPYSFAACLTYRRVQYELDLCNCTIHTSPVEFRHQHCGYDQLLCIKRNRITKRTLHHHHFIEPCLPSCTEMDITLVGEELKSKSSGTTEYKPNFQFTFTDKSTVIIKIENMPKQRYIRSVTFSRLDFIVTIGGIIGLFCGASILGLAEIVYIWLIRSL